LPKLVGDLQRATSQNKYAEALAIQDQLTEFHATMFCETNPIPVKYACSLLGYCTDEIRLPLIMPSKENRDRIKNELIKFKLLK
jgi:4-hydroxy-tetrahydrodipicolinate synthase